MTENAYGDGNGNDHEREHGDGNAAGGPQGPQAPPNLSKETPVRRLERTQDGRMIAGVCSGLGEYMGVDPNILRIALAVVTVFGGAGVAAYLLAWFLIPETGKTNSIVQDMINKPPKA